MMAAVEATNHMSYLLLCWKHTQKVENKLTCAEGVFIVASLSLCAYVCLVLL